MSSIKFSPLDVAALAVKPQRSHDPHAQLPPKVQAVIDAAVKYRNAYFEWSEDAEKWLDKVNASAELFKAVAAYEKERG